MGGVALILGLVLIGDVCDFQFWREWWIVLHTVEWSGRRVENECSGGVACEDAGTA